MTTEPATPSSSVRLSVVTTAEDDDDAFPDFSDPNLFTVDVEIVEDANSRSRTNSVLTSGTLSPGSASPTESSVSNTAGSSGSKFLLPIPKPATNTSQTSFALSEVNEGEGGLADVPPEILSADISISADGSFVETTSGPAARELKRRYDQQIGVNKDMRSPYIITAIINQHGKQVYRVGMRAQATEPSPTPELDADTQSISSGTSQAQRKRRSRMSINGFLKGIGPTAGPLPTPPIRPVEEGASKVSSSSFSGPRKLRKPRSIPDLASNASGGYFGDAEKVTSLPPPSGRAHSHSVTGADMPRPIIPSLPVPPLEGSKAGGDAFSSVMGWASASFTPLSPLASSMTPSSHSLLTPSDGSATDEDVCSTHAKLLVDHPFGHDVAFDAPERSSSIQLPGIIREMQSFESAMTARARPTDSQGEAPLDTELDASVPLAPDVAKEPHRPDSYDSIASTAEQGDLTLTDLSGPYPPHTRAVPSVETNIFTRYPTTVFDVIQNYRGLPMLDALDSAASRQPTIKLSLSTIDGAVPRDDPRFVIWGELDAAPLNEQRVSVHEDAVSPPRSRPHSHTYSISSRKRSIKGKSGLSARTSSPSRNETGAPASSATSSVDDSEDSSRRVLMAATIERWIAQLTSQFDYDELLIFFLTYRTYIDALDLCHLLICRFHWALEEPLSQQEIMVKQIVRVRTFVAMRYWLLTFFRVDFLPNRELCLLFANWLNTLWRDPILDKYNDARNIVRKLKKVAKDCREAHSRQGRSSKESEKKGKVMQSIDKILGDLSSGVNFAASLRKVSAAQHEEEDSDVDLDFNPEESSPFSDSTGIQGFTSFANQLGPATPGDAPTTSGANESKTSVSTRPTNTSSTSRILLQQPLHLTILQHARALPPGTNAPMAETTSALSLPVHHSALSRVVVNTIGRLGRWKRVLSSRSPTTPLSPCGDVSAFDLELNAAGDLFTVRGGVEQYLKMIDPIATSPTSPLPSEMPPEVSVTAAVNEAEDISSASSSLPVLTPQDAQESEQMATTPVATKPELTPDNAPLDNEGSRPATPASMMRVPVGPAVHRSLSRVRAAERAPSIQSYSSGSLRSLDGASYIRRPGAYNDYRSFPDVVSIDDLDYLSDESSNEEEFEGPTHPPGLRPTKRLPLRREFEFVRRSVDSVSSMGIISRESAALSDHVPSSRSSFSSPRGLGDLRQWQVNALLDDLSDEGHDPGDADAALRRLEGQINHQQQRVKEAKVNGWVRTIQERMAAGDFGDDQARNVSDDDQDDGSEVDYGGDAHSRPSRSLNEKGDPDVTLSLPRSSEDSIPPSYNESIADSESQYAIDAVTPTPRQTAHPINATQHSPSHEGKPKVDDAVPEEILMSRLPSKPPIVGAASANKGAQSQHGRFVVSPTASIPMAHRTFVLYYTSAVLAQHFAVIDREIFLGIKFEELVSDEWMRSTEDYNVLDWMSYLRDRRRKAELRGKSKISVLGAARARFNLVANFVVSEIALTNPHDRVLVVGKFIRIAWKAYTQNNFATLVAVISGLNSEWVRRAMKRSWSRVGIWEMRVFEDLKAFCTAEDDFRYIRKAIVAIVDAKPLMSSGQDDAATSSTGPTDALSSGNKSKGAADGKTPLPTSCVPFIGVYLSQLYRYSQLPDLIDPSAPNEPVDIDPESGNFKAPAHPEVFSDLRPLPASMQIEPLINIQKQRKIAGVIKSLVAGQHLANKVEVNVDKRLLSRCLKLNALSSDALQRIFAVYSDY